MTPSESLRQALEDLATARRALSESIDDTSPDSIRRRADRLIAEMGAAQRDLTLSLAEARIEDAASVEALDIVIHDVIQETQRAFEELIDSAGDVDTVRLLHRCAAEAGLALTQTAELSGLDLFSRRRASVEIIEHVRIALSRAAATLEESADD